MADERYQWLDQEAAERLLRGEPVDPADDADAASRAHAALLARTLDSARTPVAVLGPDGELPGEAAALAAFRKDTAERTAAAAAARYATPAGPAAAPELGSVRIAPAPSGHRWGRSLRYGLAAALAAVTVGGVAVAAGTGMLPLTGNPAPARSVSAVDTPDGSGGTGPAVPGSPSGGTGSAIPSEPLEHETGTATPGATDGPTTATAGPGGGSPSPDRTTGGLGEDDDERRKTLKACREFQDGKLADSGRQRLQSALRNGETVKRYCTRVLSGSPATGSTSPGRTPSGDGADGGGDKGGGSNGGSDTGGSDGDDKGDRGDDKHHPDAPGNPDGKPGAKPGKKPGAKPGSDDGKPDGHGPHHRV
ncbi:hypothetical protein [Streptomyces sp. NBC_01268]|uniref:hypothetical protein n=1 Tax=unclassified Streptomyces TaxID=2593676 RepID=UPI002E316759|nr:hypothetical protein [Streptomyces sp. NBC_01268]